MNKDQSKIMQGVAILLMLFLHLFNRLDNVNLCHCFLYIYDVPFAYILTRATNPVPFYLILSGYGLYIVEHQRQAYNVWKKIVKLYIHYWISLLIFVPLGACIVGTTIYPGGWKIIFENITGWYTNSWNAEVWFLFPYVIMALTSNFFFRLLNITNNWMVMGGASFLSIVAMFCISKFGTFVYGHQLLYLMMLYFEFLFPFTIGTWMAKYHIVKKFRFMVQGSIAKGYVCWLLLILLVSIFCFYPKSTFLEFYAFAFIVLFVNAPRLKWVDTFLMEMGKRSTSIWFVHTYFCYYLFHDFIYGFRYPIVIFLMLLSCSYASAVVIDWINNKVQILIK